ncbi:zinc finger protein 469 [Heterocephalus glaber]|uniref:Zinc finger protein 469 n=1 Tax=Heterocephalus glaber TaxID=10181 RepID=A0AAX6P3V6_HETGA|nr:zinc finger protein 469 [Heterocephalus glaber]
MPGEQPRGAPPPGNTRDLHPCPGARGLRPPSQPPHKDQPPSSRTAQGTRGAGSRALAREPPTAQLGQALEVEPQAELLRPRPLRGPLGKGGGPDTPPSRSHPGEQGWLAGRVDSSPPQLYGLGIASPRAKPTLDKTPKGRPLKPQDSQAEACRGPSLPGADILPTLGELSSKRCFQEAPSSFTSSNHTSPSATPGPPRAPPSSPPTLASPPELQANGASPWPPAAEDNFPGANFGRLPSKSEPFPEGSRPGSPRGSPFPYPLRAQPPHEDPVGQAYASGALAFSLHQPPGGWPEVTVGTGPAYRLPPMPSPLPCYPSHPGGLKAPGDCAQALSPPGADPLAPRPFSDSLHRSLAEVLPEGPPSGHERLGSPRAPPNPGSQRHFLGQTYRASGVGSSPGPGDATLATPRPLPARLPQLWDPTAAAYPEPTLCAPPTPRAAFFDSPSQGLCLPQSPTVPWPSALPSPGPSRGQLEVLRQLPFPRGTTEWQEGSQGALGAASQAPGPGETVVALRSSPGQPGSSPGLLPYSGMKGPGPQALLFGGTQPQASPRGAPALPPPRVVGVSPSESPLPSPATNTASSSTCSSLSPLSSSPANPSSEDSQLPAPLGPSGFFLPAPRPQEPGSPFPPPELPNTRPAHFPLPSDGLGPEGALEFLGSEGRGAGRDRLRGFPRGPAAYATHHFPLSSASLDQLDVLLTCRQCDRNYSSLAAFLEHRQFCSLLLARHGPQGHLAPTATPKVPAPTHPGLLGHGQTIPFLLAGDLQAESKDDDALRTSFLPSLAAPPFPLPTSDLDLEDNAKLDSLITEALNGMQDPSDSPEIDSSFIDVFADEDPPGPRGPGTGQALNSPAGATPEYHAQPLPPAGEATPQPQGPYLGDRARPAGNRPTTPSLGPAPTEATEPSLGRQPRRGKQLKVFWKGLDAAHSTKGPGRALCPRPGRRGHGTQQPPPYPRDLRTQAKGHMGSHQRGPGALLSADTGITKRLRLPPRKDPRKRRTQRGGSWSKELIHKIVLQKNRLHRPRAPSKAPQGRPGASDHASESEEESPRPGAPGLSGRSHQDHQQRCLGKKMKEEGLGRGPSKAEKPGSAESRGSPAPGQLPSPAHSPDGDPRCNSPQVPTDTTTPGESHPSLGLCQAAPKPEAASPTKLREVPTGESGCPKPPTPEPPPPGRAGTSRHPPSGSHPNVLPRPAGGALHDREDAPAHQPRGFQMPVASPTRAAYPEHSTPFFKNSDLGCKPAHFNRDSVGVPAAKKGPQPSSSAPSELFLRPKDPAVDTPPASSCYLGQDHVDALKPKPPKNPPYTAETDPGRAQSPLSLESMTLFAGLPEDGFDPPPLYDSLSPHRATPEPLACADPLPRKPLIEPLFPPFLLLEEVSPTLSSQFPDLSVPKAFHKKCPHAEMGSPSPAPVPGKRNGHTAAFMSNLSEDELEIKRLVSELESQLQRRGATQEAPEDPSEAARAASLTPARQAALSHSGAAHLPGPGETRPEQEDAGTAMPPRKGALQSSQGDQPCPATCCPGKAAPSPGPPRDLASGAPSGPMGCSLRALTAQKSQGCKATEDPGAPSGECRPEPTEGPKALLEAGGLAERSPNRDLLSPRSDEWIRTRASEGSPLPQLPWEQNRARPPEPQGAEGPCPGRTAPPAPGQVFRGSGEASLGATPASDPGHSHASKGPAPRESGPPRALAEGSALQHQEAPSAPGCPAGPASSPSGPLRVLGTRAEDKGCVQLLQGPLPAGAPSPRHRAPPSLGGDRVTGGSPGHVQDTATATVSEANGHLGSPDQAKKPRGQGKVSHCLPGAWKSPRARGSGAKANTPPRRHGPAKASARAQGGSTALGPQEQVQPAPSPQRLLGMAAHAQQGPEDRTPGEVTSQVPPPGDLVPCTAVVTPSPFGLEHTPQEDPSCMSLGGARWVQAPAGARATGPPAGPSWRTSLCGPEDLPPPALLGASSPEDWPGLSDIPAPSQGQDGPSSSTLGTLVEFRRGPGSPPASATPSRPGAHVSPRRTIKEHNTETVPTECGVKAVRGLRVADPSMSWDPSSHPPCLTPCLSHGGSDSSTATPTDPTTAGPTQPGPSPCLETEAGAVSEGQEDAGTRGHRARCSSVTKLPGAGQGLTTAHHPPAASSSNTAGDSGSNSPQSHTGVPHQMPHVDSLSPQDPKQEPYGLKKKLEPTERRKGQAPAGPALPCVTCDICSASFRSGPGLSRHKARKHRPDGCAALGFRAPGKRSHRVPGKEGPSQALIRPSHPAGPAPPQGSTTPEGTPGPETEEGPERGTKAPAHPLNRQPHPPGLMESGEGAEPRPHLPEAGKLHPRQTERKGQRRSREPQDSRRTTAPKPQENVGKTRARRPRGEHTAPGSASAPTGRCRSRAYTAAAHCSAEGQQGADRAPGPLGDTAGNTATQKSPGGRRSPTGRAEEASPGELPEGWKGALAGGLWGPTVARTSGKDPSHASAGEAAADLGGPNGSPGDSVKAGTLDLPGMPSSEAGRTSLSCPQDPPEAQGGDPEAPSIGCRDPLSVLDDDVAFAQLFPPGGRFARKKNPRVYQKPCGRPRCLPPTQPLSQPGGDPLSLARLPTDLSDSGSLCLSCEDLLGNEAMELPEAWLLDGPLSSSTPGLGLWTPEPRREAGCVDKAPPCGTTDDQVEAIPELHRVPAAWQGLGLRVPPKEASSPLGDVSPEPPNLEREGYEEGLPRTAEDLEMVGTTLQAQDPSFPRPWEDLVSVPSTSALDVQEEAAGLCQARGREQLVPGRSASFKCRVCFRRFHGLGELDLHRLAHSAAPPPTCYMCVERRFGSRQLLREHLQEKHVQGQMGPWACGMCLKEVPDVWMYNQHLREHAALFARRGQARRALGELPAGSGDEGASAERATDQRGAGGAGGGDGEGGPGDGAGRPLSGSLHGSPTPPSMPGGDSPATPSPSREPRPHGEPPLCRGPVHADCKDPSRDCHHCGKRFPKPFKLQRHLAVHSPQRVYLCPRCPRVYAAHRELRAHLGSAHGAGPEARDVAPTPLFACERCADVARVTRRAFACSACNYTFARREQLDRHREKHRRACPRPCALRGVRRPGAPEGALPLKRRRLAQVGRPVSPGSPALPRLCPQAAPGTAQAQERREDPAGQPDAPPAGPDLPPPALSPPASAQAEGREGCELDRALERLEGEASAGSPGPRRQQAPRLGSGKRGPPGGRGRCAPDGSPGEPSLLPKEKQVSPCHVVPEGRTAGPSHEDGAKLGGCRSASKPKPLATTPSRVPGQPRKPAEIGSPAPGELAHGPEDRAKPTTPKARPRPSSQGRGSARPGTKTAGGSQPQPASGRLQSETATTPAKPRCPGRGPAPHPAPPRAQGSGCQEKVEGTKRRRNGPGPGPARRQGTGSAGRAPSAPDRPPRAPRKQATPSRVLPAKPRPSTQISKTRPQPWETRKGDPGPGLRREELGKAFPQVRRGRSVPSTRPAQLRDHRTAESQSDLLSQLFGQRLTSFKIPLKKDTSE